MWVVRLTKVPTTNDFRKGFFPRRVWYKTDARKLVIEVQAKGGDAEISKEATT